MIVEIFIFYILVAIYFGISVLFNVSGIHFLNAGDSVQNNNPGLKTYCHNATSKYLTHMWRTMTVRDFRDDLCTHKIFHMYII